MVKLIYLDGNIYKYGGFFTDADAYCIEPVTYLVDTYKAFACYENETIRNAGWCPSVMTMF